MTYDEYQAWGSFSGCRFFIAADGHTSSNFFRVVVVSTRFSSSFSSKTIFFALGLGFIFGFTLGLLPSVAFYSLSTLGLSFFCLSAYLTADTCFFFLAATTMYSGLNLVRQLCFLSTSLFLRPCAFDASFCCCCHGWFAVVDLVVCLAPSPCTIALDYMGPSSLAGVMLSVFSLWGCLPLAFNNTTCLLYCRGSLAL